MVALIVFLYGLLIGSFLNVVAYRVPKEQSIVTPGSYCPSCKTPIKLYDNIPILSYLVLRAKCRQCGENISPRYLVVELTTAALFVTTYLMVGFQLLLIPALVFVALLFVVLLIDMDHQIIPNGLVIFGLAAGFVFLIASYFVQGFPLLKTDLEPAVATIGSGLGAGIFLLLVAYAAEFFLKKEAMGGGDIKLAAVLGLFLGPYVFLSLFLAFFLGAIISVVLMATGIVKRSEPIAFGPFMSAGALLTLYFGPQIIHLYVSFAFGKI